MTLGALYRHCKAQLLHAGVDSPEFDAGFLMQTFLGADRTALILHGDREADPDAEARLRAALAERSARRPLQYIAGTWDFMGLTLSVGEGVLVPREDTEILVRALAACLSAGDEPLGVDLCAGTGAVALGLCTLVPNAFIGAVELSPAAYRFLKRNTAEYPAYRVRPIHGDAFDPALPRQLPPLDFIASNPPYIATGELPGLQAEVRREPAMALDGGPDGLSFYGALLESWLPSLRPGGYIGFEIGDTQAGAVVTLLAAHGLAGIAVHKDLAGHDRAVTARKL